MRDQPTLDRRPDFRRLVQRGWHAQRHAAMRYTLGSMIVYIASSTAFQVVSAVKGTFTNIEKRMMDVINPLESTQDVSNR